MGVLPATCRRGLRREPLSLVGLSEPPLWVGVGERVGDIHRVAVEFVKLLFQCFRSTGDLVTQMSSAEGGLTSAR